MFKWILPWVAGALLGGGILVVKEASNDAPAARVKTVEVTKTVVAQPEIDYAERQRQQRRLDNLERQQETQAREQHAAECRALQARMNAGTYEDGVNTGHTEDARQASREYSSRC